MRYVLIGLFLLACSSVSAQTGRMLGRVLDADNNPIPAVTIYVVNGSHAQASISNSMGYFTFLSVPTGKYTVKAFRRGLPLWERHVDIASATLRLDIKLKESEPALAAKQAKAETRATPKPKPATAAKKPEQTKSAESQTQTQTAEEEETEEAQTQTVSDEDIAKDEGLSKSVEAAKAVEASDAAKVDTKPEVLGGMETINRKIIYPEAARAKGLQGGVIAKVSVDQNGNPTKVLILKATDSMFSEEVFRVLSEDVKFKPATLNGKPVASAAVIYVEFKLN
ncbi:MAG: TonB family protein [Chloroherpetonaceae bacterium]|nr:TonB family protein [Chloroherpetonaceae bacterium]MDW8437041.1 TonB family protein [Chloroherpetonaceae bacterium]